MAEVIGTGFIGGFIQVFFRLIGGAALWFVLSGGIGAADSADFTFAALGDTPYSPEEEERFPQLIAEMNRENLAFVVHIGDFKSSIVACSDELYRERRGWFELSHHPFLYVPGDNEWADCRRPLGAARDPLERLDKLRELFFADDASLGQRRIRLERQSRPAPGPQYPEHSRWQYQGVLFLTLNVPGSGNFPGTHEEFVTRNAAIRQWLGEGFALARTGALRGVVIFMQGNPWNRAGEPRGGFAGLLETLAAGTRDFSGQVLLVNGDTHRYRVDQPLRNAATGAPFDNFTRVVVFGSPWMNWVRVRVIEQAGRIRFEVTPGN